MNFSKKENQMKPLKFLIPPFALGRTLIMEFNSHEKVLIEILNKTILQLKVLLIDNIKMYSALF